jgi:cell division topological specificity factor
MRNLFQRLSDALGTKAPNSKDEAKQRLKLLLIHDQVDIPQAQLERMKSEILDVIAKYCEVQKDEGVEFKLNREDGQVSLVSTIPVRRVNARA